MSNNVQDNAADNADEARTSGNGAGRVIDGAKRKPLLMGFIIAVLVLGAVYFLYELVIGSRSVSTENAYVGGENAQVTPLTSGQIKEVLVINTQPVRKGQLLMRLDDADQKIALAQAEAMLALAERRWQTSRAQAEAAGATTSASAAAIPEAQARLAAANAALEKAQVDYRRRTALVDTGAVSGDEVTSARNELSSAKAAVEQARASLAQAQASAVRAKQDEVATLAATKGTTQENAPEVLAARSRLAQARLDLERTMIRAPIDGVVAQRSVQVGQRIDSGKVAMTIVPVGELYVDANFKEDQLGKVRPGQTAELHSDFYGSDVTFHGKVIGFAGGTGAAFSLIPAQNATGNWIKVVQRLPVRIALDPGELKEHPLRVGLSMEAEIDLTSGK